MRTLSALDYLAIAIYMALVAGIGVFLGRFIHSIEDYLKGGSVIPWVAAGISNYMGLFSTFVFVAYAGIAYNFGLVALTILWSTVPACIIAATLLAGRWRRAGILTPVEFLETRFNASTRQVFSWGGLAFRLLDNMVRLYAFGLFLATVTSLDLRAAVLLAGVVSLAYTVVGGLWAVVVTDVVQFVILIFTTVLMLPLSLRAAGGLGTIMERVPEHFGFFQGPQGALGFLAAYYLMVTIKYNGNWAFIQRFYSVRDEAAARKTGFLMAGLFFVTAPVFLLPPIAARVALPTLENPEMAYGAMALHVLPSGIMGLMVAAMFAATMDSLASEYNVMSGVVTRDIYVRLFRPGAGAAEQVRVARATTLLTATIMIVGALFMNRVGGAFEANKLFTGLFAIPMTVPLVLGLLLRGPRPWGAMATVVAGVGCGLYLHVSGSMSWQAATLVEIAVCAGVMLASNVVGPVTAEYRARVGAFFSRLATPVPESEKPVEAPGFRRSLANLFAVVFAGVGVLYLAMSVASLAELSGRLAVLVGGLCLVTAAGLAVYARRQPAAAAGTSGSPPPAERRDGTAAEAAPMPDALPISPAPSVAPSVATVATVASAPAVRPDPVSSRSAGGARRR